MRDHVVLVAFAVEPDHETISAHFGRVRSYLVVSIEAGEPADREVRAKISPHDQGPEGGDEDEQGHRSKHQAMIEPIRDCQVLIAGGMGEPAFRDLKEAGIDPIMTDVEDVDAALRAWLSDELEHQPELVHHHGPGHHHH